MEMRPIGGQRKNAQAEAVKQKGRAGRRESELAELRSKLCYTSLSPEARNRYGLAEKVKGNECFKAGEPEEAMHFYSR